METGGDILFFWVARMAMLCSELHGDDGAMPFENILIHPLVRDSQGRKMSKSLGNVLDPLHVVEGCSLDDLLAGIEAGRGTMAKGGGADSESSSGGGDGGGNSNSNSNDNGNNKSGGSGAVLGEAEAKRATANMKREFPRGIERCGADALRFCLADYMRQGRPINMDVQQVVAARHFANKIWQAARFCAAALDQGEGERETDTDTDTGTGTEQWSWELELGVERTAEPAELAAAVARHPASTLAERAVLSRLAATVRECNAALARFEPAAATSCARSFFMDDFCGLLLELEK